MIMWGESAFSSHLKRAGFALIFSLFFLLPGCLSSDSDSASQSDSETISEGPIVLEVWHTFAAESKEEQVFTNAIKSFEENNPNITVEITMIPFGNA
ncbi:MAG: hypothetical protein VW862_06875, partial [Euryarchaeota archaeon]